MKNRKGDIPIIILVLGVFVICTLALLSFLNSTIKVKNSFVGVELIEKVNIDVEKNSKTQVFEEERVSEWFGLGKEKIMFSVKYDSPP